MKKIIQSFWILSFGATSSLVLATAWQVSQYTKQNKDSIKDWTPINPWSVPWSQFDLRDFVAPNHKLNINNNQAIDPSQADLNINIDADDNKDSIINKIITALDKKYINFERRYVHYSKYFASNLNIGDYTHSFDFLNQADGGKWDISKAIDNLKLGGFSSYNLSMENLETNTSFNFSLNLTHFDLDNKTIDFTKPDTFPGGGGIPFLHKEFYIYSGNTPHYANTNTLTANMNEYVNVTNPQYYATIDSFFLNPISYSYHSSIWEDGDSAGYHPFPKTSKAGNWNWNSFESFNQGGFNESVQDPIDSYLQGSGKWLDCTDGSQCAGNYMSVAMYTNDYHINNSNTFSFQGVGATEATMDQYPHGAGDWAIIPFYGYNYLYTSYKKNIFLNSTPYQLDAIDSAQTIWNRLTDLGTVLIITNPNVPSIKNPWVQGFLRNALNIQNKNVLTSLQLYNITFTLASGSDYFVDGINDAIITFHWYGQTIQDKISIEYHGVVEESAQDIANKLAGKTIVLDPKFWVGKDIKNYKQQLDALIVQQGILTKKEVQYVSWGDLKIDQARKYPNCDFNVTKDGQTATAHDVTLNIDSAEFEWFNKINQLIGSDIIQKEGGQLLYQGPLKDPYGSIDTSDQEVMLALEHSVGKDPLISRDCPNFNKEYSPFIYFNEMKITNGQSVNLTVNVDGYTKSYKIKIWWKTATPK